MNLILFVGIILTLGCFVGRITHALKITGVVGYLMAGIILGPSVFGITNVLGISEEVFSVFWNSIVYFTLALIAFIIGAHLTLVLIRELGKPVIAIILGESLGAFLFVLVGVYLYTQNLSEALFLASLAPATAPAGTIAILHEYRAKGPLTNALLEIVGFDDALAILIFVIGIAAVKISLGGVISFSTVFVIPAKEIFGGLALGAILGLLLASVIKKIKERESMFIASLGAILVGAGLANILGFSLILTCMGIGMVFINLIPTRGKAPLEMIEGFMAPLYVLFFAVAGVALRLDLLYTAGIIGVLYVVFRIIGKIFGTSFSAKITRAPRIFQKYLGFALFSQAGVQLGLVALAGSILAPLPGGKELAALGLTIVIATTIVFQIIGSVGVRLALTRAGETTKV